MTSDVLIVSSTTRPATIDRFVGMQIFETNTQRRWMWTGSQWAYQGGGLPPRAYLYSSVDTNFTASTREIYWLSKVTEAWDNDYFTYVNGTTSTNGDKIKITQSGNYEISHFVHTDRGGAAYFAQSYPVFSPTLANTQPVAATGSGLPSGWQRMNNEIRRYITAGTEVELWVYANQNVAIYECGMYIQMVP
jgi:hypothetical protein